MNSSESTKNSKLNNKCCVAFSHMFLLCERVLYDWINYSTGNSWIIRCSVTMSHICQNSVTKYSCFCLAHKHTNIDNKNKNCLYKLVWMRKEEKKKTVRKIGNVLYYLFCTLVRWRFCFRICIYNLMCMEAESFLPSSFIFFHFIFLFYGYAILFCDYNKRKQKKRDK